jgi:hypothetical protein
MTAKAGTRVLVLLAIMGIAVVPISYPQTSSDSDKAELLALNQHLMNAFDSKDASAFIAFYSDDPERNPLRGHRPPFSSTKRRYAKRMRGFLNRCPTFMDPWSR